MKHYQPMKAKGSTLDFLSDDEYESLLYLAAETYGAGDFLRAEFLLQGLNQLHPNDSRPYKLLGALNLLQRRHAQAEEFFVRALDRDPDDPYVLVALAELKLKSIQIEAAVPLFERLFSLDPTHPAVVRGRTLVMEYYGRLAGGHAA